MWKRHPAVRSRDLADKPSVFVLLCIATIMVRRPPQRGHVGTNGEGGGLRRDAAVTPLKSHPRSTKSTRGGSVLAPTESPILPHAPAVRHISPLLSVRAVCVPIGVWFRERVRFHLTNSRSFGGSLMITVGLRADTLCAWVRHETRDQPHTR